MLKLEYSSEHAQLQSSKDSSQIECSIWFLHQRAISNCRQYCFGLLGLISAYIYIYIFSIYQISGWQFSRVLIGSRNSEYPWLFTVLRTERKMARRFAKVFEEEIKTAFFYPSDLVNTKTTIPLRVGEERWIYTSTLRVSVYIHHYPPPLRGIVV